MDSSKFKDMRFYTVGETQRITGELEKAVTIPVHVEVEAEHRVYDMSEMREILMDADRIALQDYGCKTATTTATRRRTCASASTRRPMSFLLMKSTHQGRSQSMRP